MKRDEENGSAWIWGVLIALGLGALVIGGTAVTVIAIDRKKMRNIMRGAFERYGLPGDWGAALSEKESASNSTAVNMTGTDKLRGGAWGPTQITALTARAFGYNGPMERLIQDPEFAADLTARMVKDGFAERRVKGVSTLFHYGPPTSIESMASVWNAGRKLDDPNLPPSVKTAYVPGIKKALQSLV